MDSKIQIQNRKLLQKYIHPPYTEFKKKVSLIANQFKQKDTSHCPYLTNIKCPSYFNENYKNQLFLLNELSFTLLA